jgi:hypothetical protein
VRAPETSGFRGLYRVFGGGETLTAPAAAGVTATAAAQDVLATTTLASGIAVSEAKLLAAHVDRQGADAADTLGNDVAIVAIIIQRET